MRKRDNFFVDKRSWSTIKDQVLESYMYPYISKIKTRGQPILLIDGYAGPGEFEDGKPGSPLIMCRVAEKLAPGKWKALFINKEQKHYNKLNQIVQREGWSKSVTTILGDTTQLRQQLFTQMNSQSVFLYLDPFGPTGCNFDLLEPFLKRNPKYSTEILLTMNMPGMHRLATPRAIKDGRQGESMIRNYNQKLTNVFGGEYWKEHLWRQDIEAKERELSVIQAYQDKLAHFLPFTGSCPVQAKTNGRIKYFIVFASGHKDALILLNDSMIKAYVAGMHKADFPNGLWKDTDWREMRYIGGLEDIIINTVRQQPGETREFVWFRIVQAYFMRYLKPEYTKIVQRLVEDGKLISPTPRKTKQLNENCTLFPGTLSV